MSNQTRGLERHVDPDNPTGTLLDHLPDLATRRQTADPEPPQTNSKPAKRQKESRAANQA